MWFITVRATGGGVAGGPGVFYTGAPAWTAAGFCSVTGDDQGDDVCN